MSRKYRQPKQRTDINPDLWLYLIDRADECANQFLPVDLMSVARLAPVWRRHREAVLTWWVEHHPGTRPSAWWRLDAPEPQRLRLGGTGRLTHDVSPAIPLEYWCGVPNGWHTIDRADPPRFEAEFTYLKRHDLLVKGERGSTQPETVLDIFEFAESVFGPLQAEDRP